MLIVSKSSWLFLGSATSQKFNHTMDWLTPARLQPLGWPAKLFTCHQQSISLLTVSQCSCAKVFKLKWHTLCEQTKLLCSLCHLGKVLRSRPISLRYISMFLVLLLFSTEFVSACGPGRRSTSNRRDRKLTPLVFKQHIPNVSENTLGASGLSEGRVTRNHKRFKELVPNYNADIIFKDDEGTGADRLMTQRLKEKLNTLAISVMNQWPGIKLRVTQAWHEGGQYAGDSLHYEGRAVDITTSDKDRAKLGMLARLAVEAGFEWVYYESRIWIHCSVKSEKSDAAKNGGCFDENSVVYDRNGPKLMKNLQIGDQILSMGSNGQFEYSEVVMFIDRDMTGERLYYHIETESGSTITITPSHLLFVTENNSTSDQPTIGRPRFAQDISVGQYIYTRRADNQIFLDRVIKKTTSLGRGAFAPLTTAGNLVVNNVTASCYAVIESQTLAHWAFLPVRWAHFFVQLGDRLSGYFLTKSSSSFTQRSTLAMKNSPVIQDGIHWYPRLLYKVFRYLIPSRLMYN